MAVKSKKIDGFIADMKVFRERVLPKTFVAFQKWIALKLYGMILEKTPVDNNFLRGSWTISIDSQDTTPANRKGNASQGEGMTSEEISLFESALAQFAGMGLGHVIWINNAMPYVLRIEFDGHSSVKAPAGMVQISIQELKSYLQTIKKDFVKVYERGEI